jgi:hypothetical protein
MIGLRRLARPCFWATLAGLLMASPGISQVQVRTARKPEMVRPPGAASIPTKSALPPLPQQPSVHPEPVAETKLLMEGISQPNFQGIQRNLAKEPASVEQWTFLRGQALLVAETGNLLMLRPPKNQGEETWYDLAAAQRNAAARLARAASNRDYVGSRVALADLTNACNKCHRTFRIPAQLDPLPGEKPKGTD